ncbi:hypothetical protein [Bacillus sp. B-jedd]|uniref:hypothetical protein n=1 Tax=Bacillus sp. B-jedd TaxID=1476857 RepID=UPI0005155CA8|nr:hypothetical protein [Bacillus sp. B-jedd]CEG29052.1 Chromosome partition protein Smc [Bacillus sp. B-jedd]
MEQLIRDLMEQMNHQFTKVGVRFDQMDERFEGIENRLDGMDQRFEGIENRLDGMDSRFEGIENRLDGMDQRFEGIENRIDGMDQRFEGIEIRLNGIDVRLDGIDSRLETLTETVNNHATEFRSHFKRIETKLDEQEKVFTVVADEIKGFKYDISHLSAKSGIHETEISNLKKRIQL